MAKRPDEFELGFMAGILTGAILGIASSLLIVLMETGAFI